jgi:hypothetical protein
MSVTDLSPGAAPLPKRRAANAEPASPSLPRRTSTVHRVGRHRSLHRISVASDAPALVLAVPGTGEATEAELADHIAESASDSCPGVDIRIGFLDSDDNGLADALAGDGTDSSNGSAASNHAGQSAPQAVVVPLLAGSHPDYDLLIATILAQATAPVMLASHLGPHPLLAGALHDRLSEVGLARASRARGLNIAAGSDGVLVVADRGAQSVSDAGVTAVLLAARLAIPVVPASLGDSNSVASALDRLREAGARHPAISPCLIGPETNPAELTQLSVSIDAPCAAPLGTHPAIAQLAVVRYGEALARLSVASH